MVVKSRNKSSSVNIISETVQPSQVFWKKILKEVKQFFQWGKVSYDVDPIYSRIDTIFVLRKQKRPCNGRLNPISYEVVYDLYSTVKNDGYGRVV